MRTQVAAGLASVAFLLAGMQTSVASGAEQAAQHLTGKVSQLDTMARTFSVTSDGGGAATKQTSFKVAPDAKIMQGAKAISLSQLETGQRVKVEYADQGTEHRANRVDVLSVGTPAAKADKAGLKTAPKY